MDRAFPDEGIKLAVQIANVKERRVKEDKCDHLAGSGEHSANCAILAGAVMDGRQKHAKQKH